MFKYLKNELKHIPVVLLLFVLCYGITTFAEDYLFNSNDVKFDNSNVEIQAGDVQGAIDEIYTTANSHYTDFNNRLANAETTIGNSTLTTTSQTLTGGICELKSDKADKSSTVSTVNWDTTNKKLTKTINGSTTDVVTGATILNGLTSSQVTTALGYTPPTTDTNTWRPVQNNLTSTSTTDCLSAAQGKALNDNKQAKIGTTTVNGTTDSAGDVNTGLNTSQYIPVAFKITGGNMGKYQAYMFQMASSGQTWWIKFINDGSSIFPAANTTVVGTLYYLSI